MLNETPLVPKLPSGAPADVVRRAKTEVGDVVVVPVTRIRLEPSTATAAGASAIDAPEMLNMAMLDDPKVLSGCPALVRRPTNVCVTPATTAVPVATICPPVPKARSAITAGGNSVSTAPYPEAPNEVSSKPDALSWMTGGSSPLLA